MDKWPWGNATNHGCRKCSFLLSLPHVWNLPSFPGARCFPPSILYQDQGENKTQWEKCLGVWERETREERGWERKSKYESIKGKMVAVGRLLTGSVSIQPPQTFLYDRGCRRPGSSSGCVAANVPSITHIWEVQKPARLVMAIGSPGSSSPVSGTRKMATLFPLWPQITSNVMFLESEFIVMAPWFSTFLMVVGEQFPCWAHLVLFWMLFLEA